MNLFGTKPFTPEGQDISPDKFITNQQQQNSNQIVSNTNTNKSGNKTPNKFLETEQEVSKNSPVDIFKETKNLEQDEKKVFNVVFCLFSYIRVKAAWKK
jgi:hypothetical protein